MLRQFHHSHRGNRRLGIDAVAERRRLRRGGEENVRVRVVRVDDRPAPVPALRRGIQPLEEVRFAAR